MGKRFEYSKKTSSPEQLQDAKSFLRATGRKERSVTQELCFYHRRKRGFDSRETIVKCIWTHVKSLPWQIGLGVLSQWKCTREHNMQCRAISPLQWKAEGNYRALFPFLPSNCFQQAATSTAQQCSAGTRLQMWASSHQSLTHAKPTILLWGIQIAAASWASGGAAHVWSSHCIMTATKSANASGWVLAWTVQSAAKIRASNMENP